MKLNRFMGLCCALDVSCPPLIPQALHSGFTMGHAFQRIGIQSPITAFFGLTAILSIGLVLLFRLQLQWDWVIAYVAAINAVEFVWYGFDKLASVRKWMRVPERVLHVVMLIGATPAAIAGQKVFRHKTSKASFRTWFWVILGVQLALIAGWIWVRYR